MANSWLRLWHDMPNDPKWRTIARKSGQSIGNVIAVYLHVLVNASGITETTGNAGVTQSNAGKRGVIKNLCADDVASSLDLDSDQVEQILSAMQGKVLDGDVVTGWAKRQPRREDDSAARVRALREKRKAEAGVCSPGIASAETQSNAGVTQGNAPDKDTDTDLNTDPPLNPPKGKRGKNNFDPLQAVLPDWLPKELWREWVEYRRALRKPIKTPQGVAGSIRELEAFRQQGIPAAEVIRHSMAREYQGLYAPGGRSDKRSAINPISPPDTTIPDGFRGA